MAYKVSYIIEAMDQSGRALESASRGLEAFQKKHKNTIDQINKAALPAAGIFAGFVLSTKHAIDASNQVEAALTGLRSVARAFGTDVGAAEQAAVGLASDGLMTVGEAAAGLKNLLARGFGLDEATRLMNAFKDSAAYGRQGTLQFGESVVRATEGLKNEMSQLVDNAGVTKNVSIMWKEYAKSIGKGVQELTIAEKRQAELNGIMKETAPMLGDAATLSEQFSGKTASLRTNIELAYAAIGDIIKDGLTPYIAKLSEGAEAVKDFTTEHETATKVLIGVSTAIAGGAGLILALGALLRILPMVTLGIKGVSVALAFLAANPIGLAVVGIGAVVAAAITWHDEFEKLERLIASMASETIARLINGIASLLEGMSRLPGVGDDLSRAAEKLRQTADGMQSWAGNVRQSTKEAAEAGGYFAAVMGDQVAAMYGVGTASGPAAEGITTVGNAASDAADKVDGLNKNLKSVPRPDLPTDAFELFVKAEEDAIETIDNVLPLMEDEIEHKQRSAEESRKLAERIAESNRRAQEMARQGLSDLIGGFRTLLGLIAENDKGLQKMLQTFDRWMSGITAVTRILSGLDKVFGGGGGGGGGGGSSWLGYATAGRSVLGGGGGGAVLEMGPAAAGEMWPTSTAAPGTLAKIGAAAKSAASAAAPYAIMAAEVTGLAWGAKQIYDWFRTSGGAGETYHEMLARTTGATQAGIFQAQTYDPNRPRGGGFAGYTPGMSESAFSSQFHHPSPVLRPSVAHVGNAPLSVTLQNNGPLMGNEADALRFARQTRDLLLRIARGEIS